MSAANRSPGPTGLRRAWLREIGIDHVWALPAPPAQPDVSAEPAPADDHDAAGHGDPSASVVLPAKLEQSQAAVTAPAPSPPMVDEAPAASVPAIPLVEPEATLPSAPPPISAMPADDTAASPNLYRREPLPDPYRRQPVGAGEGGSTSDPSVYTRVPVTDVYSREPYADPAEAAAEATIAEHSPQADGQPWVAVVAPALRADQEDWVLVGEGLDKDIAAPARHRFLTAMLAAQGHALGAVGAWPQAAEEGAAALVVIGDAALAALAPGGKPYAVGEIAVDGVPLPALLLPSLPQTSLNAEGKAATWRGLLRLSAQVNGTPG